MFEVIIPRVILALLVFNTVMILFINKSVIRIETALRTQRQPTQPPAPARAVGEG